MGVRVYQALQATEFDGAQQRFVIDAIAAVLGDDVFAQRAEKQADVLRYVADVSAQLQRIELAQIDTIEHYRAGSGRVEAEQQFIERGLAAADPPQQRDFFAWLNS